MFAWFANICNNNLIYEYLFVLCRFCVSVLVCKNACGTYHSRLSNVTSILQSRILTFFGHVLRRGKVSRAGGWGCKGRGGGGKKATIDVPLNECARRWCERWERMVKRTTILTWWPQPLDQKCSRKINHCNQLFVVWSPRHKES